MLRKALDVATQAFFRCQAADDTAPSSLQSKLTIFLHSDQSKQTDATYGSNLKVHVENAKGFPDSLFVVLTFDISCGDDNLLFLYTRDSGGWHPRVSWYSGKYTKPSDAFGDFFLYTVAPGADSKPLVAVAHGLPWCTSRFSGFRLDLIQPADATSTQKLVASTENGYSRGDTVPTLKPNTDGVTLRLDASSADLEGVFTYVGVFRYRTIGGKLNRQPTANNARDFVDSWLSESWNVADQWSASPDSHLRGAHDRFVDATNIDKDVPTIHYGAVRACSVSRDQFHVQLDLSHYVKSGVQPPQEDLPHLEGLSPIYAHVRQNPNSFTMLSFTEKPDPTCAGPNLMKKPSTSTNR